MLLYNYKAITQLYISKAGASVPSYPSIIAFRTITKQMPLYKIFTLQLTYFLGLGVSVEREMSDHLLIGKLITFAALNDSI